MKLRNKPKYILLVAILATTLACTIGIGGPDYPNHSIPTSSDSINQMQTAVAQAWQEGAVNGTVTFTITEQQLTSYLATKLSQQADPVITDPQVYLQNGQIQVFGTAKQGYFQATVAIVLTAGIDENGDLAIELTSADFGPLPVPTGLLDVFTKMVEEAYTGSIGPVATGIRLTNITIENGSMTVSGQVK